MPASTVVMAMPIRIAPGHAARVERDHHEQADAEHQDRPAGQLTADAEPDRRRRDAGRPHEAGVDEADEGDEQADADGDRGLELAWHGVEDELAEAGEHQHEDDQALQHDEAHRIGPRHLAGDGVGHEGVEAESGGKREREVRRRRP